MKQRNALFEISALAERGGVPRGILEEGRIFSFGQLENSEELNGRVTNVVEGLRDHIGQPFDLHPWAFVLEISAFERTGVAFPASFIELIYPQVDGSILVESHIGMKGRILVQDRFVFRHTSEGTKITVPPDQRPATTVSAPRLSQYPLAIAILNTRGCSIDLKQAPSIANKRRVRQGKHPLPAHYDVDAAEYLTALRTERDSQDRGGTHASPIPHLRRAHERVLGNGKRIWVSSSLVNVRNEGDISFVEKRTAYRRRD